MNRAAYWKRIGAPAREARLAAFAENLLACIASAGLIALPAVLEAFGWLRG